VRKLMEKHENKQEHYENESVNLIIIDS